MTREEIEEVQSELMDEILENIEANDEADPTPLVVSADAIPDGMTAEQVLETWQQTGTTIIQDTNSITSTTSDAISAVYGTSYADATVNPDTLPFKDEVKAEPEPQPIPETPEQIALRKEKRKIRQKQLEEERVERERLEILAAKQHAALRKRNALKSYQNVVLTNNDLMILHDGREFVKTDTQRKEKISVLNRKRTSCNVEGNITTILSNGLIYDKNMNPLVVNYSPYREKSDKRFGRVDKKMGKHGNYSSPTRTERWIVVDKEAFMKSKGKDFKIKGRVGYTIHEALYVKRNLIKKLESGERFITYLKDLIGQVYDQDNFEILYNFPFDATSPNKFRVFFQFPNLTLRNSIEFEHTIENLITRLDGIHYSSNNDNKFSISGLLDGMRTKYSPIDAYYGFSHSHLPSCRQGMENFCMGSDHFMTSLNSSNYIDEIEFEMMLHGMLDHVSWESLEGGPYTSMETVGQTVGVQIVESTFHILRTYTSESVRTIIRYIKEELNLDELRDAFVLTIQRNKEVSYSFDRKLFITRLLSMFDDYSVQDICEQYEISYYSYYPADDQFRSNEHNHQLMKNWSHFKRSAIKRTHDIPIAYINGKYIRPQVTSFERPTGTIKQAMLTFHPDIIMYIGRVIQYHLLNELKNEKVESEQERRG